MCKYLIRRIIIIFSIFFYKRNRIYSNIFYKKIHTKKIRDVIFYFDDPVMMHLGDQLFYEPICRLFRENAFFVSIAATDSMRNYFKSIGYNVVDKIDFSKYDLIITSTRFLYTLRKVKNNILFIRTEYPSIDKPLINDLITKLSLFFSFKVNVDSKPNYYNLKDLNRKNLYQIEHDKKYIIFSNYLVSGSFRVLPIKFEKLENFARCFIKSNPDFNIIHLGTKNEMLRDKKNYSFVNIDLRGKTNVEDLYLLASLPNVYYYIGFDSFLMHLFFLQNKKAFVMSRGRWSKKSRYFLENYIDPPFKVNNISEIKEYIR
jgi:ADP-heptose:LPS heptosyltransferase